MSSRGIKNTRFFSNERLTQFRQQMDPAADAVIASVAGGGVTEVRNLLLERTAGKIPLRDNAWCRDFYEHNATLPTWTNRGAMERGMALFQEHKDLITVLLGCLSLPYTYLGADGVQVLMLSQRMQKDTRKRLEETGEFVFGITEAEAWKGPFPDAVERILNVRLIHAAVRWFSLHSGKWNAAWGMPVNQEDMAGTNLSFSYQIIQGLRKMKVSLSEDQEEAYLHFWRVVGWMSGVDEEVLPVNLREAYVLNQAIARRSFRPSAEGQLLAKALITTMEEDVPEPLKTLPTAQMRYLLGDEWADQLGLPSVRLEKKLVQWIPTGLFFKRPI